MSISQSVFTVNKMKKTQRLAGSSYQDISDATIQIHYPHAIMLEYRANM